MSKTEASLNISFRSSSDPLTELAKNQFLLIDSMSFAMKYSIRDRKKIEFEKLLKHSFGYFDKKVKDPHLQWAEDIKVAFAVLLLNIISRLCLLESV